MQSRLSISESAINAASPGVAPLGAEPPGRRPPTLPIWRALPPLLDRDLLRLFESAALAGPVVRLDVAGYRLIQVSDPALMREVLLDKAKAYRKGRLMRRLGAVTGEGLLINDGEVWKRHRRLTNPALAAGALPRYVPAMRQAVADTIARWRRRDPAQPLDLLGELSASTLACLLDSIFGIRADARFARVSEVIHSLLDELVRRGSALVAPPLAWPTPANWVFRRRIAEANAILDDIIATRSQTLADHEEPADLLGQWLVQRRRDGEHFSDGEMRDELMTMLIAGHQSLAIALAWALYHVAQDPALQTQLQQESDGAELPSEIDEIDKLPLARGAFLEALRLYPQPPILLREAMAPHRLGGYRIRRGDQLLLCLPALHRGAEYWSDPERFDASRYTGFNVNAMMQGGHLGFGGGSRSCIGRRFALLEGVLLIAAIARAFTLRLAAPDADPVPPRFAGMLVPARPLRVLATAR